jgi:hypothetical protein
MGDQQSGDGPQANEPADEGAPRGSPVSRGAGQDNLPRSGARGASPADDDHASDGSLPGQAAAGQNQRIGRRLRNQLTGSPLRKGLAALATAALTAAVAAIVGALVSGWFSGNKARPIVATPVASGPPIRKSALGCPTTVPYSPLLASVHNETSRDSPGLATILPGQLNLSKADLQLLDKEESTSATWPGRDGYDGYATHIKLTLTGCQSLRILGMRAVILTRSRPLTGTLFQPASQGSSLSVPLRSNLDSGSPVAMALDNSGHLYNYFERYTFTLAPHEQHTFEITGMAGRWAVTWKLDVEFLIDNRTVNETVQNDRQPFKAVYGACYGYGGQPWPSLCGHVKFKSLWAEWND